MSGLARRSEVGADGDPDASFNHLATRAALLRSLQPAVAGDPEMQKSIEQTIRALERRMNPDAAPSPPSDGRPGRRRSR